MECHVMIRATEETPLLAGVSTAAEVLENNWEVSSDEENISSSDLKFISHICFHGERETSAETQTKNKLKHVNCNITLITEII